MIWEEFRRADHSLELEPIADYLARQMRIDPLGDAGRKYLRTIEAIRPIVSRQLAAVAIATAVELGEE